MTPPLVINVEQLDKFLNEYAQETRKSVGTVLRKEGGFFSRYLAASTAPLSPGEDGKMDGQSLKAREMGRAAVRRDIGRVYVTVASVVKQLEDKYGKKIARRFGALIRSNRQEAQAWLRVSGITWSHLNIQGEFDGGALHRSVRQDGRVPKGNLPVIIFDAKELKDYVKKEEKKVGFGKSGWIRALRSLGLSPGRVSKWMDQSAPGSGQDRADDPSFPAIHLTNRVPYIEGAFDDRKYASVQRSFAENFIHSLAVKLDHLAKKKNRDTQNAANSVK